MQYSFTLYSIAMNICVTLRCFVKLSISFVVLTLTLHVYQNGNALKYDEVNKQAIYNTGFLKEEKWFHRPQEGTRGTTKNKTFPPTELTSFNRVENNKLDDDKNGKHLNAHVSRTKKKVVNVASSMKNVIYNLKNQQKLHNNPNRVRRNIEHENFHEQIGVQCEVSALSCRDCCENSKNCSHKVKFCHCDSQCTFYNDCCVDHETFCGKKREISFGVRPEGLSCLKRSRYFGTRIDKVWLLNKCPKNRKSDEISQNCESADELEFSISNLRYILPVVHKNNLLFRNEFCAKCNSIEKFEYFGFIDVACFIVPPTLTFTKFLDFASKHCELKGKPRIYTDHAASFRECNQYFQNLCPTLKELNQKCKRYGNYKQRVPKDVCIAAARWCDLKNSSWKDERDLSCCENCGTVGYSTIYPPHYSIAPFSLALRLSRGRTVSQVKDVYCPDGRFYDEYLETCRLGQSIPPIKKNLDKYLVAIWLSDTMIDLSLYELKEIISSLAQLFTFKPFQASESGQVKIGFTYKEPLVIHFELELSNEQTLLLAKSNYTKRNDKLEDFGNNSKHLANRLPLQRLLFFSEKFNVTTSFKLFTVLKTTSRQLACIRKKTYPHGTYTVFKNGEYYYINSTGKTFEKRQTFFKETPNKSICVCEQIVFSTCVGKRVNLTSKEFVKFDNLSIFYKRTKTTYDFGEYDIEDGDIFMCISEGSTQFYWSRSNSFIQTYLALICFILSLFCLFLVIQTYTIFSEFRNLPGKNILNLTISLFLSQFLWLFPKRWYTTSFCHVVAAIQHYFFLVSFVAMAIIAWNTHWAFARKNIRADGSVKREEKKFRRYSVIIWVLPAVFVAACAFIDEQGIYAVYVNEQFCWFDNMQAQKYLFVLPVGLLLLFNTIFFALTVYRIQRARSAARLVRSNKRHRAVFWIYFKLSTLMGFSWLFGFINLFVDSTLVFSYFFVIFASLQGVYISLALVMKKKVWKKYKRLLQRKQKISDGSYTRS